MNKRNIDGRRRLISAGAVVACLTMFGATAESVVGEDKAAPAFERIKVTDQFFSEGAAFGDFNKDGKQDVAAGPFWYAGPDFKSRKEIYPVTPIEKDGVWYAGCDFKIDSPEAKTYRSGPWDVDQYSDAFFVFADDLNADDWTDVVVLGFPGKSAVWYENPKNADGHWRRHLIMDVVDNESPHWVDVDGDGKRDLVCSTLGRLGYATRNADAKAPWTFHPISALGHWQRFTHGLGVGDVNGDGKMDLLDKDGWFEQPTGGEPGGLWKQHKYSFSKNGGAQMFVYDVDGDGDGDVLTSLEAHGYGYVWYEQLKGNDGIDFKPHVILDSTADKNPGKVVFSQLHAQDLIDMDGDGLKDVVIGKRKYAHGRKGDPDPTGVPYLYWLKLKRSSPDGKPTTAAVMADKVSFEPMLIDDQSGVGVMVQAGDVSGDSKPDVVVGCKLGVFVLIQK